MPSLWQWSATSRRYRDTRTGRFISQASMVALRDQFVERQDEEAQALAGRLAEGRVDVNRWVEDMRTMIKESYINEYILAHGGRHTMSQADWGRIGAMVKGQYGFLQRFAEEIQEGMTEAQIAARAQMYIESATQAFERGKAAREGLPDLPQYPADGGTQCLSLCRCFLRYVKADDGWRVYWTLGDSEHCPDCIRLASEWNPLEV